MIRPLSILILAAVVGGATWLLLAQNTSEDDFSQVLALCKTIPKPDEADTRMAALGWQPLDDKRSDQLLDATALFHVATRRTGKDTFDATAERRTFDGRRSDAEENLARADVHAYGRESDSAIAVIGPVKGSPEATSCDLFLPPGTSTAGFEALVENLTPRSAENGWARWSYNKGQGPRPGPWAINLAVIDPAADDLVDFLGETTAFAILSRNSFRGLLPE